MAAGLDGNCSIRAIPAIMDLLSDYYVLFHASWSEVGNLVSFQKAEEMLDVANYATGQLKNNAAVTASVHCAMNAIDALSVFYLGGRHSGLQKSTL